VSSIKAEIFNSKYWVRGNDINGLENLLEANLIECEFSILDKLEREFKAQPPEYAAGLTVLWLIEESHLALHTFLEDGEVSYVELSSCNMEKQRRFHVNMLAIGEEFGILKCEGGDFKKDEEDIDEGLVKLDLDVY